MEAPAVLMSVTSRKPCTAMRGFLFPWPGDGYVFTAGLLSFSSCDRCGSIWASSQLTTASVDAHQPRRPGRRNIEIGSRPSRRAWRSASWVLKPRALAVAVASNRGPCSTASSRVMLWWTPEITSTPFPPGFRRCPTYTHIIPRATSIFLIYIGFVGLLSVRALET